MVPNMGPDRVPQQVYVRVQVSHSFLKKQSNEFCTGFQIGFPIEFSGKIFAGVS